LEYGVVLTVIVVGALVIFRALGDRLICSMSGAQRQFMAAFGEASEGELALRCASSSAGAVPGASVRADAPEGSSAAAPTVATSGTLRSSREPDQPGRQTGPGATTSTPATWQRDMLKVMCPKDKVFLQQLRASGVRITAYDRIYFDDPYYDGTQWTTKRFEAGGTTSGKRIDMIRSGNASNDASTIYHEGVHTQQKRGKPWREQEYDAYTREDAWRLRRGLPPHHPSFRKKNAAGHEVTDTAAVHAYVDKHYPGVTSTSATGAAEEIVDKNSKGETVVRRADGTEYSRPPKVGDSFSAPNSVTVPAGGVPIDMNTFQCP
jgi:hypothetical protein